MILINIVIWPGVYYPNCTQYPNSNTMAMVGTFPHRKWSSLTYILAPKSHGQ